MRFCSKCGKEILEEAIVCPNCGCATVNTSVPQENADDKVSVGLCVLAALIPLFGIIYWPIKHKETPKKAQACGIVGIISWAISFCFGFIIGFLGALSEFI